MTDNRKIDALVAEKVMELSLLPVDDYEYQTTTGGRKCWDGEPDLSSQGWEEYQDWERFDYYEERYWRRPIKRDPFIKPYSTDIAAAWTVVEKLKFEGYLVEMEVHPANTAVTMSELGPIAWASLLTVAADTSPLAICLAALKLKGVEV